MNQKQTETLKDFIRFCKKELEIQSLPKISLATNRSFVETQRSFGVYDTQDRSIQVYITGRNLADICRSLAHELVHHRQLELNQLYDLAGNTGSDIENDANAVAGILMREYGKLNVNVYDLSSTNSLNEIGEARAPYPWKYDFVDDDENYFYSFNTPENEYSVGISANGQDSYELLFNTVGEMGQDTGEGVALRVLSTVVKIALDFIERVFPAELILRPIETKQKGDKPDTRRFNVYGEFLRKNIPAGYKLVTMGNTYRLLRIGK